MTQNPNSDLDDLAERAARLLEKAQTAPSKKGEKPGIIQAAEDLHAVSEAVKSTRKGYQAIRAPFVKINDTLIKPIRRIIDPVGKPLWHGYKWLYDKTNPANYKSKPAKTLASIGFGLLVFLSVAVGAAFVPGFVPGSGTLRHYTTDLARDTVMIVTHRHSNEVVYLTDSKEPEIGVYSVKGCRSLDNCNRDNSVYYRLDHSVINNVWSLVTQGKPYAPDLITAAIAPGVNKCEVTSYGLRFQAARAFGIYPTLLSANCTPLTINNSFEKAATIETAPPAPVVTTQHGVTISAPTLTA